MLKPAAATRGSWDHPSYAREELNFKSAPFVATTFALGDMGFPQKCHG